jgi:hypothetical protein
MGDLWALSQDQCAVLVVAASLILRFYHQKEINWPPLRGEALVILVLGGAYQIYNACWDITTNIIFCFKGFAVELRSIPNYIR